jgi:hypothetical protein
MTGAHHGILGLVHLRVGSIQPQCAERSNFVVKAGQQLFGIRVGAAII